MHRLLALPALLLAAGLAFVFWSWMGRPIPLPDAPGGRLQCLSYTPYDGGSSPLDSAYTVRPGHILAELKALHPYTECIRTYSSMPPQGEVVRVAQELGMKVYLGIWISANGCGDCRVIFERIVHRIGQGVIVFDLGRSARQTGVGCEGAAACGCRWQRDRSGRGRHARWFDSAGERLLSGLDFSHSDVGSRGDARQSIDARGLPNLFQLQPG